MILFFTEYDDGDGDGDGDQSHDNSYSFSEQQSTTPNKRRHENGSTSNEANDMANDETDEPKDGESSTSAESGPKKKRRKDCFNLNATFMAGIQNVVLVTDQVCFVY